MPVSSNKSRPREIGWLFWVIVFAIVVGPAVYGTVKITEKGTSIFMRVSVGAVAAAVGAGVVSMVVNGFVQYRYKKRRLAERKKSRKRK